MYFFLEVIFARHCKAGVPRSKKRNITNVGQRDVVDSDLPVKSAVGQERNNPGQVILIHIVHAEGDVWHPIRWMIVIHEVRTRTGSFLPERLVKLCKLGTAHNRNVKHWM